MKEITLKIGNVWTHITAILITIMLCGTAIFISLQYNQSQKNNAEAQVQAIKEAGQNIGNGICKTSTRPYPGCN